MAFFKERNGRWNVQIYIKPLPRRSKTFSTREEGEAWACATEAKLRAFRASGMTHEIPHHDPVTIDAIMDLPRIPAEDCAVGIYFLFKKNECIYVGQSRHVHTRVREHRTVRNKRKDFDTYAWLPAPADRLDDLELHYITKLLPRLNEKGNELAKLKKRIASRRLSFKEAEAAQARIAELSGGKAVR